MEKKLIELLNEYRTEKLRREMYVNGADKETIELSEAERINEYEVSQTLDSQNYLKSFVKWLVDNDKIDFDKTQIGFQLTLGYGKYESLLMILSIQDSPIEFLCGIIKN